ncbi:restriction endonuclease subunit S [Limnohabitans sp. G3-2]|uniref:restriction endonuclease subunit S n=1 Tax=Limnohabitans sp. G3-2 TaxID=1100711 RepID=UPI0013047387|nr:restriction endonuclease subunit S [Limnohabitans sp. G3-2]
MQRLDLIAEINPTRKVRKGSDVPFVDMAALPQLSRDISLDGVVNRVAKGAGAHFQNGDTLLARITPCLENGKTAQVRCLDDGSIAEGSTEFIVLCGKDPADNDFIYYLCRDPIFREYAIGRMEGTSGRQRVSWQSIAAYEFSLPPADERRSAARVLSALDDRITLLRETNTTLEAIAQALFKSWFVDFDPVHAKMQGRAPEGMDEATAALFPDSFEESELGDVPKGWRVERLGEVCSYLNRGISPKYLEEGGVLVINQKCIRDFSVDYSKARRHDSAQRKIDGRQLEVGDILVNSTGVGTLGRVAQVLALAELTIVDSHVTVVRAGQKLSWPYLGQWMTRQQSNIEAMGEGSTGQTELARSKLAVMPIVVPSVFALRAFDEVVTSLKERITVNETYVAELTKLRDTLLPRLISGQLSLAEVVTETI